MRCLLIGILLLILVSPGRAARSAKRPALERVRVSTDGRGFVLHPSGRRFTPWGVNYGNEGRLIEDFWDTEWATVEGDFREIRDLGYNVVRVHLQLGKFMIAPDRMNRTSLDRLRRLLLLAEETGLYLDLTGLACYRKADVPAWYDTLSEGERWEVQARFWRAIADRCAGRPVVFCYDLMNEPLSPGGKRKPGEWYSGTTLGGYDFLQFIALDQGERERSEIARQWIQRLREAIRREDRKTLITVGLLPWDAKWGHLSGFVPEKMAPELDFVSVHIYPETGKVPEALDGLKRFVVGKPVVIEETFPLNCPPEDLEQFLLQSRAHAAGWLGHYDGRTIADYEQRRRKGKLTLADSVWLSWLELSIRVGARMTGARE